MADSFTFESSDTLCPADEEALFRLAARFPRSTFVFFEFKIFGPLSSLLTVIPVLWDFSPF